jgi:hypothetical protein
MSKTPEAQGHIPPTAIAGPRTGALDAPVTRRGLLRGAGALGLGSVAGGLLAACDTGKKPGVSGTPGAAGEGGGPSGVELGTPTPSEAPIPEAKHAFAYGEGVSPAERAQIEKAVTMGTSWLSKKMGVDLSAIKVVAGADPNWVFDAYKGNGGSEQGRSAYTRATAYVGGGNDFYVNTASPGWTKASPIIGGPVAQGKDHTVVHELTHIAQNELAGYIRDDVGWLYEGMAHYAAARGLAENGIYDYAKIRAGHVSAAGRVRTSLDKLTNNAEITKSGDNYSLAFLAVEALVKDKLDANGKPDGGMAAIANFWGQFQELDVRDANDAFSKTFGKNLADFYSEFHAYRAAGFQAAA